MIQIINLKEVIRRTGLSRSSIYEFVNAEKFPCPIKLSERRIGWVEQEICDWLNVKVKGRTQ